MKTKLSLSIAALSAIATMGLASCASAPASVSKEITLNYVDGASIANANISVLDGEKEVATGVTDSEGKFAFTGESKAYTVNVANLPNGYQVEAGTVFPASDSSCTITASSAVIESAMPSNHTYEVGDIAYDFSFSTTTNQDYTLSSILAEKDLVVINFWATWCGPCMSEFQAFNDAYVGKDGDAGFQEKAAVIELNIDLTLTSLKQYVKTKTFFTDFLMTTSTNALKTAFGASSIPTTIFINKYGRIQRIHSGSDASYASWRKYFSTFTGENAYLGVTKPYEGEAQYEYPESVDLEAVACASGFSCTLKAPSRNFCNNVFGSTDYLEYLWPFLPSEDNRGIYASNSGYDGTLACTILACALNAGETLSCDLLTSSENVDYFLLYQASNTSLTAGPIRYSGVANDWQSIDIFTAEEAGTYQFALMFQKDDYLAKGEDTVFLKNFHVSQS